MGAEAFRRTLADIGVADEILQFELFDGGHYAVEYRQPRALAWLAHRLAD